MILLEILSWLAFLLAASAVALLIHLIRTRGLPPSLRDALKRTFSDRGWLARLWPLWLLFLVSFLVVLFLNPMKAGLVIYAISKILLGGLVGLMIHWGFRRMHPMPDEPTGIEVGTDWKCAAWIICAAVIALALVP